MHITTNKSYIKGCNCIYCKTSSWRKSEIRKQNKKIRSTKKLGKYPNLQSFGWPG